MSSYYCAVCNFYSKNVQIPRVWNQFCPVALVTFCWFMCFLLFLCFCAVFVLLFSWPEQSCFNLKSYWIHPPSSSFHPPPQTSAVWKVTQGVVVELLVIVVVLLQQQQYSPYSSSGRSRSSGSRSSNTRSTSKGEFQSRSRMSRNNRRSRISSSIGVVEVQWSLH